MDSAACGGLSRRDLKESSHSGQARCESRLQVLLRCTLLVPMLAYHGGHAVREPPGLRLQRATAHELAAHRARQRSPSSPVFLAIGKTAFCLCFTDIWIKEYWYSDFE
ncbi:hypothetical protein EJB05_05635, partial [Eragrostis curvula]